MTLGESHQNFILNIDRNRINDYTQTVESSIMELMICNRYTDDSRMQTKSSNLVRFLMNGDKHHIGRKGSRVSLIADQPDKISKTFRIPKALLGYPMITISAHYMV